VQIAECPFTELGAVLFPGLLQLARLVRVGGRQVIAFTTVLAQIVQLPRAFRVRDQFPVPHADHAVPFVQAPQKFAGRRTARDFGSFTGGMLAGDRWHRVG
jgi:hypothetical protein